MASRALATRPDLSRLLGRASPLSSADAQYKTTVRPANLRDTFARAVQVALSEVPGPVHLGLPEDLGYEEVAALPKPFGFTEFGPHGAQNPPGNYDYRRFIAGIQKDFPKTCFFKCWNAKWSLGANEYTKEILNLPVVVNREDLPAVLFKTLE